MNNKNKMFMLTLFSFIASGSAFSANINQIASQPVNKQNIYGICKDDEYVMFRCEMKQREQISLCAAKDTTDLSIGIKTPDNKITKYPLADPRQLVDPSPAGSPTIVQGYKDGTLLSLYVYIGRGYDDNTDSALVIGKNNPLICKTKSVKFPSGQFSADVADFDIERLIDLHYTKDIIETQNRKERFHAESALFNTWPPDK